MNSRSHGHIFSHRPVPSDHRPITHIFMSMPLYFSVWNAYIRGPFRSSLSGLGSRWSFPLSTSVSFRCTQHPLLARIYSASRMINGEMPFSPRPHALGRRSFLFRCGTFYRAFRLSCCLAPTPNVPNVLPPSVRSRGDAPRQIQSRHVIICGVWLYRLGLLTLREGSGVGWRMRV